MRRHEWIKFGDPIKTKLEMEFEPAFWYRCSGCHIELISSQSYLKYVPTNWNISENCDEEIVLRLMKE